MIEVAGMGVFADEEIPKGCVAYYRGETKSEEAHNPHYTWTVREWDKKSGISNDVNLWYLDATDLRTSNWTRYVNCPNSGVKCNLDMDQYFGNVQYITKEVVAKGDELFIDYGRDYRISNFGMKTKRYDARARCPEGKHLINRLKSRALPQSSKDTGFSEEELLPSMNLFVCVRKKCPGKGKKFFCDGCETTYPLIDINLFCLTCSKIFCEGCRNKEKVCHEVP